MTITPRSLFNIVLKIFGLFFLREIINEIPTTISRFIEYFSFSVLRPSIGGLIITLMILGFYTYLVVQLLLRTNKVIDLLKLDKGFSEYEFSFEQHPQNKISLTKEEVLTISLIVIGGVILVDEIPNLCRLVYLYVDQQKSLESTGVAPSMAGMVSSVFKILCALLILGERKRIINFFEGRKSAEDVHGV